MFGYITVNGAQLSKEGLARYKACYCGLCRSIGRRYGQMERLTLSNDMTFLAMLLQSLYEPREGEGAVRCPVHPLKPRPYAISAATDYAADMNLLLAYYMCLDDQKDDHNPLKGMQAGQLKKSFQKIAQAYPEKCRRIGQCLTRFDQMEKDDSRDIDGLCNLTGEILGEIFAWKADSWEPMLRQIGAGLGRFIYFMDAYEDFDADQRRKRFNPLKQLHDLPDYEAFCQDTLRLFIAEATETFEMLPLEKDLEILRNVMYTGVWTKYVRLNKKRLEKEGAPG